MLLEKFTLTEITRATKDNGTGEGKMKLMDDLRVEYSLPGKLIVLTRRQKLSAFYRIVHHRAPINITGTESGESNSLLSHLPFLYRLSMPGTPKWSFPFQFPD